MVLARKQMTTKTLGLNFYFPNFFEQLVGFQMLSGLVHLPINKVKAGRQRRLGYFYCVEQLRNDVLLSDVLCFRLVGEANAMAQYVFAYGANILGYNVAAPL